MRQNEINVTHQRCIGAATRCVEYWVQCWKQTFWANMERMEASFEAGQKNRQPADYLPTPTLEAGCSSFVIRASATRCVECFQYPTLEVFDASCSRGLYCIKHIVPS